MELLLYFMIIVFCISYVCIRINIYQKVLDSDRELSLVREVTGSKSVLIERCCGLVVESSLKGTQIST